ncbi:MAG TPA: inositol monophosphatase [Candidatus Sulfotelmatobacter sp.]|jgi:myo-inositol-1(or 4)-monophosphatase|nr:inositol monophosphatase [Candidatus Sulfotelmatobacter sp.]
MNYSSFIKSVLKDVTKIANEKFGKVSSIVKGNDNNQVLTEADLAIGKLIVEHIQKEYPDYNIIDEEAGVIDNGSPFTWVVDPVDGTSNFANGVPMYGIMLGLLEDATPIAGGIALPYFKEIYIAEKGQGAYCNDNKITVASETKLLNALVSYGIDGHQENPAITEEEVKLLGKIILAIRNLRSSNSVFDIALVIKGNYGAMLNRTSKIWDNVAPHILVEEAGGIYTDFFGNSIDYSNPLTKVKENFTLCAASPILHKELQTIISQ